MVSQSSRFSRPLAARAARPSVGGNWRARSPSHFWLNSVSNRSQNLSGSISIFFGGEGWIRTNTACARDLQSPTFTNRRAAPEIQESE